MRDQIQHSRHRISRSLRGRRKRRSSKRTIVILAVIIVLVAVFVLQFAGRGRFFYYRFKSIIQVDRGRETEDIYQAFSDSLKARIGETLAGLGIWQELISEQKPLKEGIGRILVQVPDDLALVVCNLELSRLAKRLGGEISRAVEYPGKDKVVLQMAKQGRVTEEVVLVKNRQLRRKIGTIALIVDDFGGDIQLARRFCELDSQLSFSVLPYLRYSRQVAELAFRSGHEVILHLPMEPQDASENDPGKGAILVRQSTAQIRTLIRRALADVPHAKGVNNHMGSRATENRRVMETVLKEIKRRDLFFVDSMTSSRSVGYSTAKKVKVQCGRRDVFIDYEDAQKSSIEARLLELSRLAAEQQEAIGIGHIRENTLKVLEEMLPKLQKRGFKLVLASKIVK